MNKIEVRHTSIVINNYEMGDCKQLEYYFSKWNRITFSVSYIGIYYDEQNKRLFLPRGIDIPFVENHVHANAVLVARPDPYDKINIRLKSLPRDDVQREALMFMLGEGKYRYNKEKSQLSVNLNTGAGKTYATIAAIAYMGVKAIIITSRTGWLEQWKDKLLEYTDIEKDEIFMISGSPSINRLLKRGSDKYKIFLCNDSTIRSYAESNGWEAITRLFREIKVGVKAFDEAHLHFDNMAMIDFYTNTTLTYYVTATPARSDEEENRIYSYYFKTVPSIELFDEENDPRTRYLAIIFNSKPSAMNLSDCRNRYGLDRNAYTNYIVGSPIFNQLMHVIMDIIIKTNGKVLIYIGTNAAIQRIYEWIETYYNEFINDVGIYTSMITTNKKEQLEKKIILSTTKSCGAASDIANLKATIVLAEPFKSEVLARQTLGRTRARDTIYIDCVDEGFAAIKRYYLAKKAVFEKYAIDCRRIRLTATDLETRYKELSAFQASLINPVVMESELIDVVEFK